MPLYFFDVSKDGDVHRDAVGVELRDDEEARCEALGLLLSIVGEAEFAGSSAVVAVNARGGAGGSVVEARCEITVR